MTGTVPDWGTVVPVDDVGYPDSRALKALADHELVQLITQLQITRYQGWRNHGNLWVSELLRMTKRWGNVYSHDGDLTGAQVLDYGCGTGVEGLQYARAGAVVSVADLSQANVDLATRVLQIHGYGEQVGDRWVIGTEPGFLPRLAGFFDVIHCAGVLHHIRDPQPVMAEFAELLEPDGELRLMLYSDRAWEIATGTTPPDDTALDPALPQYVRTMDAVGEFADWYDATKLTAEFGDLFTLTRCTYLTPDRRYLAAILEPR
jgi:SAM-dependent methyltransferase